MDPDKEKHIIRNFVSTGYRFSGRPGTKEDYEERERWIRSVFRKRLLILGPRVPLSWVDRLLPFDRLPCGNFKLEWQWKVKKSWEVFRMERAWKRPF